MFAISIGTFTVAGVKVGLTSWIFWLVLAPLALAAGFWGPPLICELAYRSRYAALPLAIVAVIVLVAGHYLTPGGIRP
jgi:hypothetical protein